MLPKCNRIPKSDFKKVFKEGRYLHSKDITLLYLENQSLEKTQFAIIIKSKITGAVGRNKIKRMIKRILSKNINLIKKNFQIIFLVRNNLERTPQDQLEHDIKNMLEKAKLYIG